MSSGVDKFKNSNEYKKFLQDKVNQIYKGRDKISKKEFISIYGEEIKKLNPKGLARFESISATDGDGTTISKNEMMTIYSLMDLDLSKKTPDGHIDAENSLLNNDDDENFEHTKKSLASSFKDIKSEQKEDIPDAEFVKNDSSKVEMKFKSGKQKPKPEDYTYEGLKNRFPEPEYTLKHEAKPVVMACPPYTIIYKDGKEVATVYVDGCVRLYKYDEHGNKIKETFSDNGKVYKVLETKYLYDKNGNITSEKRYQNGEMVGGYYKEYDKYGNTTFEAEIDGTGKPIRTTETKYKNIEVEYDVIDEEGDTISLSEDHFFDTQEELESNSKYLNSYLKSEIVGGPHVKAEIEHQTVKDSNGNIMEEKEGEYGNSSSPIADEIYKAITAKTKIGIPTTDIEGLKKAVEKLNASNIETVLKCFYKTYNTDMLKAIKEEWGARITNREEMNNILAKVKTVIAQNTEHSTLQSYLFEALSNIPDTEFADQIIMSEKFNDITATDYFLEQNGKSLIQTIMDKNLTISLKTREKWIKRIIDLRLGKPEDYGRDTKHISYQLDKIRQEAYLELENQINKFGTMDSSKLEEILENVNINNEKNPNMPNGKIDKLFSQGNVGDCWLISAIMGIALTSKADKYFSDILSVTDSGNVQVKLKGAEPYTISVHDLAYRGFLSTANGDGDVKAIEKAVEKHLISEGSTKSDALDGETIFKAFELLVGADKIKCYVTPILKPDFINKEFNKRDNAIIVGRVKDTHEVNKALNSKGQSVDLTNKHGFTISRADDKYVYFIDPNVGVEEYHISIEDFYKAFDTCAIANLE